MSYNEWGYNPYDEPDYSGHPNSDNITRNDDTGDGVVGGYSWGPGGWTSLPDDGGYDDSPRRVDDDDEGMPRPEDFTVPVKGPGGLLLSRIDWKAYNKAYSAACVEREAKKQADSQSIEITKAVGRAKAAQQEFWSKVLQVALFVIFVATMAYLIIDPS